MTNHYYGTCEAWSTGSAARCTCPGDLVWQVVRRGHRRYDVCRFLDGNWTRFMTATSRDAAIQLVASLQWLTFEGLRRAG